MQLPTGDFEGTVFGPPIIRHEGTLKWFWRTLRETANPNTMHTEDLTPVELERQANFESLDYHKPYTDMYVSYLRECHRDRRRHYTHGNAAVPSTDAQRASTTLHVADTANAEYRDNLNSSSISSPLGNMADSFSHIHMDTSERHVLLRWLLHVLIALSVGVVATVVSYAVDILWSYRTEMLYRAMTGHSYPFIGIVQGFFYTVFGSVGLLAIAAAVVVYFEPAASGGGIPDVMAYLNGVHLRKAMNLRTFIVKAISCVCAVAGGLPVGLEAPLIHLGAITGAGVTQGRSRTLGFQTSLFQAFRNNKDRRDFITAGAACGVSVAFGAPIGGLLFVMEEVSSFWDQSSNGQIFLATMLCFTFSTIINSIVEDRRMLGWVSNAAVVLFEINLTIPLNLVSIVPSIFLGALIGSLAAFFTKTNLILIKWRRRVLRPYTFRRFLEPVVIGAVFSTSMFVLSLLSPCAQQYKIDNFNETVYQWGTEAGRRLFNNTCSTPQTYSPLGTLNMASGKNTIRHLFSRQTAEEFSVITLILYFIIYFVFACVTSGTSVSGGLVVPSLVLGATFGRLFGLLMFKIGATKIPGVPRGYAAAHAWMDPGVFALIGAGAFLAGTSRMSMAICVIMVELSAELHYLLPVMVAIVMAKTTADWLCEPLYHQMLHMDSVPYLPPNIVKPEFEQLTAADVMASEVVTLRLCERTEVVFAALRDSTHHAFPVVQAVFVNNSVTEKGAQSESWAPANGLQESSPARRDGTSDSADNGIPSSAGALAPCPAEDPLTVRREGARVHYKFVGLVTREDLQVYLSLPELRVNDGLSSSMPTSRGPRAEDDSDGFGGRLTQGVMAMRHVTWKRWIGQKGRLFLRTSGPKELVGAPFLAGVPGQGMHVDAANDCLIDERCLPAVLDLSLIVNRSPWVIPPFFNLQMAYQTFRMMGLRHMVVVDGDTVAGMITRKDLLVNSLRQRMRDLGARLATAGSDAPSMPPSHTSRKTTKEPLERVSKEGARNGMSGSQFGQTVVHDVNPMDTSTPCFFSGVNSSAGGSVSKLPLRHISGSVGREAPAKEYSTLPKPAAVVETPSTLAIGTTSSLGSFFSSSTEEPPAVSNSVIPDLLVQNTATLAPPLALRQEPSSVADFPMAGSGSVSTLEEEEASVRRGTGAFTGQGRMPSSSRTPYETPPEHVASLFDLDALKSFGGVS